MQIKKIEATRIFYENLYSEAQVTRNEGGARSSKSYSICQVLLNKFFHEKNIQILVTRKTLPALKITQLKLILEMIEEWGYSKLIQHNKSDRTIKYKKNLIYYTGLDDPIKIRSSEWNYEWLEEANEFTYEDFIICKTRLSAKNKNGKNKMYLSFNPTDVDGYINQKVKNNDNVLLIHSTYADNPFLSQDYIELLESLKEQDINFYKVYALGQYAELTGKIYNNYKIVNVEQFPSEFEEVIYGLDFGYNAPTGLIKIGFKDNVVYLQELLYVTKKTNAELIELLKDLKLSKTDYIYCDSAEPNRIEEIVKAGFKLCQSSDKSVKDGIDYCKRLELISSEENVNLNDEFKQYSYKKDKDGNIIDEPIKFRDHLLDAMRYALYTHFKNRRVDKFKMAFIGKEAS